MPRLQFVNELEHLEDALPHMSSMVIHVLRNQDQIGA